MLERIKALYELQLIDDELDQLESQRGDLPLTVRDLEFKLTQLKNSIQAKKDEIVDSGAKRERNLEETGLFLENQKKYKAQLFSVRNNKEYDALTKSIDQADMEIRKREMENESLIESEKRLREEIDEIEPALAELEEELRHKEAELKQIIKANERDELKIREKRAKIEARVKRSDLSRYLQIRKARNGKAIVTIRRNACTGCHYVIPSQKQLEIRRLERIYNCDSCGRIIAPAEIADEFGG